MNTTENNKLIAEFMGGVISNVSNLINLPQNRGEANVHSVKGSEILPNGTYSIHRLNELKYHTSWDWLMPVIENIDHLQHEPLTSIQKALSTRSIENTYKAVVGFIKANKTTKATKVKELIKRLQKIENKDREISIIIGNEEQNTMVFDYFELHNEFDTDTSIEIFCFDNYTLLDELIDVECYIRNIIDNKELTDKEIVKLIKEKL